MPTKDITDTRGVFKDLVGMVVECGLEGELDADLGYGKYAYREKDTDNYQVIYDS
jgi:hypothetical protein